MKIREDHILSPRRASLLLPCLRITSKRGIVHWQEHLGHERCTNQPGIGIYWRCHQVQRWFSSKGEAQKLD